jgi:hypothetical protein
MSKFEYGFKRACFEVVAGWVAFIVLSSLVNVGLFSASFVSLFHVMSAFYTVLLVFAMPYWATKYIIGWLFGVVIMYSQGLVSVFELIIYLVPSFFIGIRFVKEII